MSFVSQQAWLVKTIAQEMLAHVQRASQSRHAMRLLRLLLGVRVCAMCRATGNRGKMVGIKLAMRYLFMESGCPRCSAV